MECGAVIEVRLGNRSWQYRSVHRALQHWLTLPKMVTLSNVDITAREREIVSDVFLAGWNHGIAIRFHPSNFVQDCLINGWKYIHVFDEEKRRFTRNRGKRPFAVVSREEAMVLLMSDEMVIIPCQLPKWREARRIIERVKKELWSIHGSCRS